MVKLVATQVLGTCGEIRGGSSPSTRTKYRKTGFESLHLYQNLEIGRNGGHERSFQGTLTGDYDPT